MLRVHLDALDHHITGVLHHITIWVGVGPYYYVIEINGIRLYDEGA